MFFALHEVRAELVWEAQPRKQFVAGFPVEADSYTLSKDASYPVVLEKGNQYYLEVEVGGKQRIIGIVKEHQGKSLGSVTNSLYRPHRALKVQVPKYYIVFSPKQSYEIIERKGDKIKLAMPAISPVESYVFPKAYFTINTKQRASKAEVADNAPDDETQIENLRAANSCDQFDVAQDPKGYVCIIEGDQGSGTGFLMREGNNIYCYTAFHVIDGLRTPKPQIELMNGTKIEPLTLEVANKRDIARMLVAGCPPALPGYRRPELDEKLNVYGNSQGRGRITTLSGKVTGVGGDEVETSAGFTSGNSGSALVAESDGMVLGVASYIEQLGDEFDIATKGTRFAKPRRVADIIDDTIEWIPASLDRLYAANRKYHDHEAFLAECTEVMLRMASSPNQQIGDNGIQNNSLRTWIRNRNHQITSLVTKLENSERSEEDVQSFATNYLDKVVQHHAYFRRLCQSREAQVRALRNYPGTEFQQELNQRLLADYEYLGDINDYVLEHTSTLSY